MNLKLIILGIILSLIILTPNPQIIPVHADDGEQQPAEEQGVIDPALEDHISRHHPAIKICASVMLEPDPNIEEEIQEIRQKYDTQYYDQYYAMTNEIDSLLNQKYGKIQEQAIEKIQELPDTTELHSSLWNNSLEVWTRLDNIEAIASVPSVIKISFCHFAYEVNLDAVKRLYPGNGMLDVPVQPTFSWIPLKDVTRYKLLLSRDPAMTEIIEEVEVPTAKYIYGGALEYRTNYFWKVMALEPSPTEWSGIWSFQTKAAPIPPAEPQPQPVAWNPMLIVLILAGLATGAVLIAFFVTRGGKPKK